jgi:protein SCO1/2
MRAFRYALWAVVAILGLASGIALVSQREQAPTALVPGEAFGQPFTLVDFNGAAVTEAAFRGQPTLVFFGFTQCPEICPTTLYELNGWLDTLGPDGEKVAAYFVTVDPERDTAEILKQYVTAISDRIVGITGDPADVAAMLTGFHVYAKKVPLENGEYTMDHTASIFLLDSQGQFVGTIGYDEAPENALAKLKRLVDRNPV